METNSNGAVWTVKSCLFACRCHSSLRTLYSLHDWNEEASGRSPAQLLLSRVSPSYNESTTLSYRSVQDTIALFCGTKTYSKMIQSLR